MRKSPLREITFLVIMFMFPGLLLSQARMQDNLLPENKMLTLTPQEEGAKQKKEKKRKDEFKIYGGINVNKIKIESSKYETTIAPGFLLGASYKKGGFLYYELGARYNNPVYNLEDLTKSPDSSSLLDGVFSIRNIDVPITFGINFLFFTSRIVGLRIYVSGVPSFSIGVGKNDLDISTDDLNIFNFYGQAGLGVDVTFIFIELGVNYGFIDQFKNYSPSKPYQAFFNLGFRF